MGYRIFRGPRGLHRRPQLKFLEITFFNQINIDTPRISQFIDRTPKLKQCDTLVQFYDSTDSVTLSFNVKNLVISILRREPDWQLSSVVGVCNSCLPPLFTVEALYIENQYSGHNYAIASTLWFEALLPFPTVKYLYLSEQYAPGIAAALQELVGSRITEVLPNLQNIFRETLEPLGHFRKNIGWFVAAQQLSDHPIAIPN